MIIWTKCKESEFAKKYPKGVYNLTIVEGVCKFETIEDYNKRHSTTTMLNRVNNMTNKILEEARA